MFSFKVSSLTLSLVLSPFFVLPAVAGGIAQQSGGAPQPGSNTVLTNPSSAVNVTPQPTTTAPGTSVSTEGGRLSIGVSAGTSQNLSQAAGLVIAALQTANTPAAQAILNNLSTNFGVGGVASTSQTIVEGIVITANQGGVQSTPATLNNYGQALAAVRAVLDAGFSPGSSVQLQVGTRVVTLSPL